MITYYFKSIRSERAQEITQYKPGSWVYVEAPTEAEIDQLVTKFQLERGHLQDALDEDEGPRLEKEGDHTYMFVRFAHKSSEGEMATAPLLLIFASSAIITVSLVRLPSLDTFLRGKIEFATTQRAKLVLQMLHEIVDRYESCINNTGKQIKLIRSRLRGHEITNQDFIDFVMIEDELNEFLAALMPTNAMLNKLLRGRHIPLFDEDQDIVEDLVLSNEQSIEACTSNIKSIVGIRDAHSSISANSLNRTMKLLTIATLGIAIPNMFFGLYSMNVGIPLQHEPWIFWVVIGFTAIVTATVFVVGRRKKVF
ncbi:MAG TPA: magnesium transporter CorA family protein [Candidatus Saccharimonadales bacterium]|nr:magnesium transporter CorA family protein [Candidatus Saccharimonadales bacterium]